jgi:hypothetical protein
MKEAGAAQPVETPASATRWHGYAYDGDEFFLAYLSLSEHEDASYVTAPWMFLGAHTLELYLKAARLRTEPTITKKALCHHELDVHWNACMEIPGCPLPFEMRPLDPTKTMFNWHDWGEALPVDEKLHYATYGSIYRAVHHIVDLKYLGIGGNSIPKGPATFAWVMPDGRMIRLLQDLRRWLAHKPFGEEIIDVKTAKLLRS